MILLAVLGAVLAASTCAGERSEDSAQPGAAPDARPDARGADSPRNRSAGPAEVTRRPRVRSAPTTAEESVPVALEERWFNEPVAQWESEKRIDLTGERPGVLVAKWIDMSDSGVELERRENDKTLWLVHVSPLGIAHSKYHQDVTVRVDGDRVVVESVGAQKIVEVRDLATGAQTSREVTDVVR
jgi:hypothetical protein